VRRLNAELGFQMLGHDVAMADAPIVLETHQADAGLACERRCLGQRELTFRFD